jgi:K+-transporting ATPase A subunit
MKSLTLLAALLFGICTSQAQDGFSVPKLTEEQKSEVLYQHVIAYAVTGISFAKSKGTSAEDYGKFIGEKFSAFWNPDDGFPMLVNRLMYILVGMHPDNQMKIVKQDDKSITFQLKNVDLAFKEGPMFDVTYQDFLDCSEGIISTLAKHMNATFSHKMTDDGWYVATFVKK